MITKSQRICKRNIDVVISLLGLFFFGVPILVLAGIVYLGTGENGFFIQNRVGQYAKVFSIIKIKTIYKCSSLTSFASFLRKTKLDELPQLINVLKGDMSLVGPRPDVEGFADKLKNEGRVILEVKPGLTGPASLVFYNEEYILSKEPNCKDQVIQKMWNEKVELNIIYVNEYSLLKDLKYIYITLFLVVNIKVFFKSLRRTIVKEDLY